jgi:hypothetical protein
MKIRQPSTLWPTSRRMSGAVALWTRSPAPNDVFARRRSKGAGGYPAFARDHVAGLDVETVRGFLFIADSAL